MRLSIRRTIRCLLGATALGAVALGTALLVSFRLHPFDPAWLALEGSVLLTDRTGLPMRRILPPGEQDAMPIPLEEMSPWLPKALVAAEDRRFYDHPGIDVLSLARALAQNIVNRRVVSGASTLSTQVIRMARPRPRTLASKWMEMIEALQMEQRLSKEEILEQYLNRAPMGGNVRGVQAASLFYFGVNAADLTLAEAALLMGLPQSPARYRPDRHWERALRRRNYVLTRMERCGMITEEERCQALESPLFARSSEPPFLEPRFCDLVASRNGDAIRAAARSPDPRAHRLATTLDPALQQAAADIAGQWMRGSGETHGADSLAIVVLEVATGAIRAWAGAPDYGHQGFGRVNHALAPRNAGSTLKPFLYAQAFQDGWLFPDALVSDEPMAFDQYNPENSDQAARGLVSASDALQESYNLPALRILARLGVERFINMLRALGLDTLRGSGSTYGLTLALGTADVRLLDLANAYACLARGGLWRPWTALEQSPAPERRRIFSEEAAWLVNDTLDRPGDDAWGAHQARFAWKTGTSNGRRDAWCVGYNPEYVVGVWVGNSRGAPSASLVGIQAAAPLVARLFGRLYADGRAPWFRRPAGIEDVEICLTSGCRAGPACLQRQTCPVIRGLTGLAPCRKHSDDASPEPEVAEAGPLQIAFPQDKQTLLLGWRPHLILHLRAEAGAIMPAPLFWYADGTFIARTENNEPVAWTAGRGTHTLACVSENGASDEISFRVE